VTVNIKINTKHQTVMWKRH